MDYISAFQSLKTNNKYARKSPHKAVLLLTVIEMYENKTLSVNEIRYDERLLSTFQKVWNRVLPNETTFFTNVYFPFWYMHSEGFWMNMPFRGKEEAFRDLWESRVKPTESRVKELIQYAVLEDGLYFMMTMPSGRSSLKRALLEEYTDLTEREIDKLCVVREVEEEDNATKAMNEYQEILTTAPTKKDEGIANNAPNNKYLSELSEDLQIALNYEYYSFLRSHRTERDFFKEEFPSVDELVYRIKVEPYKRGNLDYSMATIYENFLGDLRITLMSEDDAVNLIDDISNALALIRGNSKEIDISEPISTPIVEPVTETPEPEKPEEPQDHFVQLFHLFATGETRKGVPWTKEEEEFISLCFEKGWNCDRIGELTGRTPLAIYMRLTNNLGYNVEPVPVSANTVAPKKEMISEPSARTNEFRIHNTNNKGLIYENDKCVFYVSGSLKVLRGKVYRFNYKPGFFTVKAIERKDGKWQKGGKLLVANHSSDLYRYMERCDCSIEDIEDFKEYSNISLNQMKFAGEWYDFDGNRI